MSNKYGAKKTRVDGRTFDSQREAAVYCELKLLEHAGKINSISPQWPLNLHTTDQHGIKHKLGIHKVDFSYWDCERKERRWLEVKGFDHRDGKWRRKHAEAEYGIKIEVRR